jgi:hypothetical protein
MWIFYLVGAVGQIFTLRDERFCALWRCRIFAHFLTLLQISRGGFVGGKILLSRGSWENFGSGVGEGRRTFLECVGWDGDLGSSKFLGRRKVAGRSQPPTKVRLAGNILGVSYGMGIWVVKTWNGQRRRIELSKNFAK